MFFWSRMSNSSEYATKCSHFLLQIVLKNLYWSIYMNLKFQFFCFSRGESISVHRWRYMCTIELIDRAPCLLGPSKLIWCCFFFVETYPTQIQTCTRRSEASTLQRTEQNYVLSSSRLSLYHRLASLGHKEKPVLG